MLSVSLPISSEIRRQLTQTIFYFTGFISVGCVGEDCAVCFILERGRNADVNGAAHCIGNEETFQEQGQSLQWDWDRLQKQGSSSNARAVVVLQVLCAEQ